MHSGSHMLEAQVQLNDFVFEMLQDFNASNTFHFETCSIFAM